MLAVWLIENDVTSRGVAPSRLPVPVVLAHLVLQRKTFAWAAIGVLGGVALLGFTMFARWIPVHRGTAPAPGPPQSPAEPGSAIGAPPEGNLPVVVVFAHGLL